MDLGDIRKDYRLRVMDERQVSRSPMQQFDTWLSEAFEAGVNEPTTMVLATATPGGVPSVRMVLLKALSEREFCFFTCYSSRKGVEIASNQQVALLFYWSELERQVRIEGTARKTSPLVSDEYFNSRPFESRLSAVISEQSQLIPDRAWLEQLWAAQHRESFVNEIKRPASWGGYRVEPHRIEFWQGRPDRLHDRILFTRNGDDWTISRLAP